MQQDYARLRREVQERFDADALRSDWNAVGSDLRLAMSRYEKEHLGELPPHQRPLDRPAPTDTSSEDLRPEPPAPRPAADPPGYTLLYGAGPARPFRLKLWHCVVWVFIAIDVTWIGVVLIWVVQHFLAR